MKLFLFLVACGVVIVTFFFFVKEGYFVQSFWYGVAAFITGILWSSSDIEE